MTFIMPGLTSHQFEGRTVRSSVTATGEPIFVARDVCDLLEIDHLKALERVPTWAKGPYIGQEKLPLESAERSPSERDLSDSPKPGRGNLATLTEAGLYFLTLRSNKPAALEFARVVCCEILPKIRATGLFIRGESAAERAVLLRELLLTERQMARLEARKAALLRGEAPEPPAPMKVAERPEGWLTIPEFVAAQIGRSHLFFGSAEKKMGWKMRQAKAKLEADFVWGGREYAQTRRVFRPALLEQCWPAVASSLGLDQGTLTLEA